MCEPPQPTRRGVIHRAPILPERVRCIGGQSFAFLPHRFLRHGFFASLRPDELRLYVLLVLAADKNGLSFYHYDLALLAAGAAAGALPAGPQRADHQGSRRLRRYALPGPLAPRTTARRDRVPADHRRPVRAGRSRHHPPAHPQRPRSTTHPAMINAHQPCCLDPHFQPLATAPDLRVSTPPATRARTNDHRRRAVAGAGATEGDAHPRRTTLCGRGSRSPGDVDRAHRLYGLRSWLLASERPRKQVAARGSVLPTAH